jgi:hypothetical protein
MTEKAEDPRARFRQLPEPVRPDEFVETSDAGGPPPADEPLKTAWEAGYLGGSGMP